jgi:hypothetical protein
MKKTFILILIVSIINMIGQEVIAQELFEYQDSTVILGKKGLYQIKFSSDLWHPDTTRTNRYPQFCSKYDMVKVYFKEWNCIVPQTKIKECIQDEYHTGKIKSLKIYKKIINNIEVDYFECVRDFKGYLYTFQGFFYTGVSGTLQLEFKTQNEILANYRKQIDDFCKGFALVTTSPVKGMVNVKEASPTKGIEKLLPGRPLGCIGLNGVVIKDYIGKEVNQLLNDINMQSEHTFIMEPSTTLQGCFFSYGNVVVEVIINDFK